MRFVRFKGNPDYGQYLGVELEVEVEGGYDRVSKAWFDAADGFFILKRDGSLNHGFEIVTAPCDLREHHKRWPMLLGNPTLVDDIDSEYSRTCGLHVHVSGAAVNTLSLGKVIYFVNAQANRRRIKAIAGRDGTHYAEYTNFSRRTAAIRTGFLGNERFERRYRGHCQALSRYVVVNPTHKGTVEFRLFKGTLVTADLLACIEFADAVCHWARETSLQELTWASFSMWTTKRANKYYNLIGKLN